MQSWGNVTWHGPKWSNQKHWVGELGERPKGGVPQQPWHNTDGSWRDVVVRPPPPPQSQSQTNHFAHLQMCNSKHHPAREPRHQNKVRTATWHRHRSSSLLIWTGRDCWIPPGKPETWWLSGCMFITHSSVTQHPALNRTRVYTLGCLLHPGLRVKEDCVKLVEEEPVHAYSRKVLE